jgi:hypothetical protein
MGVFENRVLRRIFGPKMDEIIRGWRIQHTEELHSLYTSLNSVTWMVRALLDNDQVNIRLLSYANIERCYAFRF